jgi:hypothetical protein
VYKRQPQTPNPKPLKTNGGGHGYKLFFRNLFNRHNLAII